MAEAVNERIEVYSQKIALMTDAQVAELQVNKSGICMVGECMLEQYMLACRKSGKAVEPELA